MKLVFSDNTELTIASPREELKQTFDGTMSTIFSFIPDNSVSLLSVEEISALFSMEKMNPLKMVTDNGTVVLDTNHYTYVDTVTKKYNEQGPSTTIISLR